MNTETKDYLRSIDIDPSQMKRIVQRLDPNDIAAGVPPATEDIRVFRAGDAVVKIAEARRFEGCYTEHRLLHYLSEQNFEAPRSLDTPRVIGRHVIAITSFVEHRPTIGVSPEKTAEKIQALHAIPAPAWLMEGTCLADKIATLDPTRIDDTLYDRITNECLVLDKEISAANASARALCHGDLHLGNILPRPQHVVLIDFESAAAGTPAWDISRLTQAAQRYGLDQTWMRRFLDVWRDGSRANDDELARATMWRDWYGVVKLLSQETLSNEAQTELARRADWARNKTPGKWSRV